MKKAELEITTVSLAQVAEQYLAHVRALPDPDPLTVAEFLVLTAQLLLLKSRALLPRPDPANVQNGADSGEQLAHQLREYQQIKQAAGQLRQWETEGHRTWERLAPPPMPNIAPPALLPHDVSGLVKALERRLRLLAPQTVQSTSVPTAKTIIIADVAERFHTRLLTQSFISFEDVLDLTISRAEVIVTLWTVLELFKRRIISVEQTATFAALQIGRGERWDEPWHE